MNLVVETGVNVRTRAKQERIYLEIARYKGEFPRMMSKLH